MHLGSLKHRCQNDVEQGRGRGKYTLGIPAELEDHSEVVTHTGYENCNGQYTGIMDEMIPWDVEVQGWGGSLGIAWGL